MYRWITIGLLTVALISVSIWGYQTNKQKNDLYVQAENEYQRSFHELTYHMDVLNDQIATSLAMDSPEKLSPQFVDIWRVSSNAHANAGELPMGLLPIHKTEQFLAELGDFTYQTAIRNLDDDPLTDEETEQLQEFYRQSGEIRDELREAQHVALNNDLKWMDVEQALLNTDSQKDNEIVNSFQTVEDSFDNYAKGSTENTTISTDTKEHSYKNLPGDELTEEAAIKEAAKIFGKESETDWSITKSGDGAVTPMYSISYEENGVRGYVDLTVKGGHPLHLLVSRDVNEKQLSLNEGYEIAADYLSELGFDEMQLFQSSEYDQIGVYSFLYEDNGVRVFSDAVEVKVALDNGDVTGLTANNYFKNHVDRDIPEPAVSEEEARDAVNPNVTIQENHLAVIENNQGEEILTYEFLGTMDDATYRIFINAETGEEERVEKMTDAEINYDAVI
ncbi:germination protein YpeB [Oceanobacillus sp. J11TS1]|uniref:germination protein YpeB n=1 Tax=Oceanobacillus sp. J11TS1 TaxID=2807191 RepID=UPI001B153F82|nr:germination protein YpeB [Oceanobacillus sp. J11TS1]GIO22605.1 sporulation protein YpeB [Oceanobacillus sp. J11TS1]